jgi:hypothetical protein
MYLLVAAFASLLGSLYLMYTMVKESEPELADQEALDALSEEAEESDNRVTSFSPLL